MNENDDIPIGSVWQSKRESYRRIQITRIEQYQLGGSHGLFETYIFVKRNTSRRTQSISRKTLLKDYRLTDRTSL